MGKLERCPEGKKLELDEWHSRYCLNTHRADEFTKLVNQKQHGDARNKLNGHDKKCKQCYAATRKGLAKRSTSPKQNQEATK